MIPTRKHLNIILKVSRKLSNNGWQKQIPGDFFLNNAIF